MNQPQRSVGVVLPSNNVILESELHRILPPGIAVHTSSLPVTGGSADALLEMSSAVDPSIESLVAADVSVLLYACLSTSLVRGLSWDSEFSADTQARTGLPCFTAAGATIQAVRAVGARRIGLVTPYPEEIDRLVPDYFADNGIDVVAHDSLGVTDIDEVGRRDPRAVHLMARSLEGEFDALVVLATDLRTVEIIDALESELGIPVVTTNQAMAWITLHALGARQPIAGYGSLLAQMSPKKEEFAHG